MFGLPFLGGGELPTIEVKGYEGRCERAVELLAAACGMDAAQERERFVWCRERLGEQAKGAAGGNLGGHIAEAVAGSMPTIVELVLSYAAGAARGFVYLTQGTPGGSLPHNLGTLLRGALQIHLQARGSQEEAEILADLFRLAFPDLAALQEFSPLAQGMIVGVAPDGDRLRTKIYFNTRLGATGDHRDKVAGMLGRVGLSDDGLYDALYANAVDTGAQFHGVGLDLDGDGTRRAKIYVRVPRKRLDATLGTVAEVVHAESQSTILPPVAQLSGALEGDSLADEVELAAVLRDDGPPTMKVTLFFSPNHVSNADGDRVVAYLESVGYDPSPVRQAMAALAEGTERPAAQPHPLHGVGIEVPVGGQPKVNVYLQPVV